MASFIAALVLSPAASALFFAALTVVVPGQSHGLPPPHFGGNEFTHGVLGILPYAYIFMSPIAAFAGSMLNIWVYRGRPLNLFVCTAAALLATLGIAAVFWLYGLATGGRSLALLPFTIVFAVCAVGGATICYSVGNLIYNGVALLRRRRWRG